MRSGTGRVLPRVLFQRDAFYPTYLEKIRQDNFWRQSFKMFNVNSAHRNLQTAALNTLIFNSLIQDFFSQRFETANLLINFDFSRLCPYNVFTSTDVSIASISSALTKSSTINVPWLQPSNIVWVIISLRESLSLIRAGTTYILITWKLIWVDAQAMFSSHIVALLFKTPSCDVPLWSGLSLTDWFSFLIQIHTVIYHVNYSSLPYGFWILVSSIHVTISQ